MNAVSRYHLVFIVLCSLLLAGAILVFERWPIPGRDKRGGEVFSLKTLAESDAQGTPPRIEREYKIGLLLPDDLGFLGPDEELQILQARVFRALKASVENDEEAAEWRTPKLLGEEYFVERDPMVFVSRDFYLDTPDGLLLDNAVSYRLRYRHLSLNDLDRHECKPTVARNFPYRCELQAKTDRVEVGDGRSSLTETRFEFRVESHPFSPSNPPPPPPWSPKDYLPIARSGLFRGRVTSAGGELARFLRPKAHGDLHLDLRLVVVTTRMRMHLDIRSPFGSGPNPEQAFIISIDRADVFDAGPYLAHLQRNWYDRYPRPSAGGTFHEIEIEFERNVSTILDERIRIGGEQNLVEIREAFMSDQTRMREIAVRALAEIGVQSEPRSQSKYQQACRLLSPPPQANP